MGESALQLGQTAAVRTQRAALGGWFVLFQPDDLAVSQDISDRAADSSRVPSGRSSFH